MQSWELTMKLRSHSCWLIFFCCLVMPAYSRISCLAGRLSSTSDLMRRSRKGFSTLCSLLICMPEKPSVNHLRRNNAVHHQGQHCKCTGTYAL